MIDIQRLNMDSSWFFNWQGIKFILDPWLIGSEIDGFRWLNEQWHIHDPVSLDQIPEYDFILISQPYDDHCHLQTLEKLDPQKPIVCVETAYKKLRKGLPQREIIPIPHKKRDFAFQGLQIQTFKPARLLDPIYFALVLHSQNHPEALFYAPHGFALKDSERESLRDLKFKILISTFTHFKIPELMGGLVNPGMDQVYQLYAQLKPDYVLNTHDEQKKMKGLVAKWAKIKYADLDEINASDRINFVKMPDYSLHHFE